MGKKRVCTVRGKDHRGLPLTVTVEAESVYEAAARGLEEIRKVQGVPSELKVVEQIPGEEWRVTTERLLKWVSVRGENDNIGLIMVKRNIQEFLQKRG